MDIQTNISTHACACVEETGGCSSQFDTGQINKQVDRVVDIHKHLDTFLNANFFFVTACFSAHASSLCTYPLPRHGVHGLSRVVQHICCWHQ